MYTAFPLIIRESMEEWVSEGMSLFRRQNREFPKSAGRGIVKGSNASWCPEAKWKTH